jgi:hypothetical protein
VKWVKPQLAAFIVNVADFCPALTGFWLKTRQPFGDKASLTMIMLEAWLAFKGRVCAKASTC